MYSEFAQLANQFILELESKNLPATAQSMRALLADYEDSLAIAQRLPLKEAQQTVST